MKRITERKIIIHPIILAMFPALSLYVYNAEKLRFRDVFWTLIVICVFTVVIWIIIVRVVRHRNKSAVIVSVLFLLFFSYGHVIRAAANILNKLNILDSTKFLVRSNIGYLLWMVVWLTLFCATVFLVVKSRSDFKLIDRVFTVFAISAIFGVFTSWRLTQTNQSVAAINDFIENGQKGILFESDNTGGIYAIQPLPDIYYIILDGFGRADVLWDVYQYDNSELLSYLTESNFFIADQSTSNYAFTELSMASSLNLMYLTPITELVGSDFSSPLPLEIMIEKNRVFHFLRQYGYQVMTFSDEYPITNVTSADIYLSPDKWVRSGFQNELINTTPIPVIVRLLSLKTPYDWHRDHISFIFDHLIEATRIEGPVFVLAHILAPHPPFVFGEDGEHVQPDRNYSLNDGIAFIQDASIEEYVEGYRDQTTYLAKRLQMVIDDILAQSSDPPIIIIQSDHGPGSMLDWLSLKNTNIHERMSILNAYYFPDNDYNKLYDSITPVNTFRIIFNKYFRANYDLLPDKNYFTTIDRPYLFLDVTETLSANGSE